VVEAWFIYGGMALCLFALWAIGRHDLVRLRAISRSVDAEVIGHRISRDGDGTSYAATYRFSAEGETHEVHDAVLNSSPRPSVGTRVKLNYPFGRPDLARVSRPWTWLFVYATLLFMLAILIARAAGWIPAGSGDIPG
jgi:hypothetical protein